MRGWMCKWRSQDAPRALRDRQRQISIGCSRCCFPWPLFFRELLLVRMSRRMYQSLKSSKSVGNGSWYTSELGNCRDRMTESCYFFIQAPKAQSLISWYKAVIVMGSLNGLLAFLGGGPLGIQVRLRLRVFSSPSPGFDDLAFLGRWDLCDTFHCYFQIHREWVPKNRLP